MPRAATIAWAGFAARVNLEDATLADASGRTLLRPGAEGVVSWRVLDRSPVSVRLAGFDAGGRPVVRCRFEVDEGGVEAGIEGARWQDRPSVVRLHQEVAHGRVPVQD